MVSPGAKALTLTADGYEPKAVGLRAYAGMATAVTIRLKPLIARIRGVVKNAETGKGVRATLTVAGKRIDAPDGRFEARLGSLSGSYDVQAMAAGFAPRTLSFQSIPGVTNFVSIDMSPMKFSETLKGLVVDAQTGKPMAAEVTISTTGLRLSTNPKTGQFAFKVDAAGSYTVLAFANGFQTSRVEFPAPPTEPEVTIRLARKTVQVVAKKLVLDPIFFKTGKDEILSNSFTILDMVADFLKENKSVKLSIVGHTDNAGKAASNLNLSRSRAKSVVKYLIGKGVGADRLDAQGYGSQIPIASNDTEGGRAQNRRVEFNVVDTEKKR